MIEIINAQFELEKYPGKGGWVFVMIDNLPKLAKQGKSNWTKVSGRIDNYEISDVNLWPMKNGKAFLPVKAAIRKKIKKEEGDKVNIVLFGETPKPEISENDFYECLNDDLKAKVNFEKLSENDQKACLNKIFLKKHEEDIIQSIAQTIRDLSQGQKSF